MASSLHPAHTPVARLASRCDHGQRRRVITESLLSDILSGTLAAGQHLVINELAKCYEVSPTPIREAFVALEGIGIVDFFPNRGAIVRRLTRVDAHEISQVRKALECEAVRLACGQIDATKLARLGHELPSDPGHNARHASFDRPQSASGQSVARLDQLVVRQPTVDS